ncbi:MAG: hypothetical protein EVB11_05345 [Winogradskyella sp.]|nr:MAG: hypothetical protein EVB11_05345 [Winogradskyella sp.]
MGFRFQKHVKIGKRFGINISKSGITPSYRSKRGSLSSKGYSIRTGIPGLNYRKTFKKSKGSGCLIMVLFLLITSTISIISCNKEKSKPINQWYQGGTLHKSKIIDWKVSTDRNKLATCGDFCAKLYQNHSLEEIKILANNLKICIDEAVKGHNTSDNFKVSEVASMCLILLEN